MDTAKTMFPLKATAPSKRQTLLLHLWPKSVLHDVYTIRNRTKALRLLATLVAATPGCGMEFISVTDSPHHKLWLRVTNPLTLRTMTSPPIRNIDALSLTHAPVEEDDTPLSPDLQRRL